jgi:hypothetical protein
MELFVDAGRIASLEQTMMDFGTDVAAALEARIAVDAQLRARIGMLEELVMQQTRVQSEVGDRLRMLEIRAGIRPKPAVPLHALRREVAA